MIRDSFWQEQHFFGSWIEIITVSTVIVAVIAIISIVISDVISILGVTAVMIFRWDFWYNCRGGFVREERNWPRVNGVEEGCLARGERRARLFSRFLINSALARASKLARPGACRKIFLVFGIDFSFFFFTNHANHGGIVVRWLCSSDGRSRSRIYLPDLTVKNWPSSSRGNGTSLQSLVAWQIRRRRDFLRFKNSSTALSHLADIVFIFSRYRKKDKVKYFFFSIGYE